MNTENKCYFSSGYARKIICNTLETAKIVRIASAYFEPTGYQLLHKTLRGKEVRLLVGYPEGGHEKLQSIIKIFMEKLINGPLEDRTQAMLELRDALKRGQFLISAADDDQTYTKMHARSFPLHAKLYFADESKVVVTSSNMTYNGLARNVEAGYVVTEKEDVKFFIDAFDELYQKSTSISEEILKVLEEWLQIYPPYIIYYRSLINLYGLPNNDQTGYLPELNSYQRPVVSRLLRNLRELNGAMLIASTGLGKTIMASHVAAYLRMKQDIDNVIIVSPAGLRMMWDKMMANARIFSRQYSYNTLSAKELSQNQFLEDLNRELKRANEKTLLIIDESHHLRNYAFKKAEEKLRYDRLFHTVQNNKCKILLMTATPYSKGVEDINSQLKLLPKHITNMNIDDKWEVFKTREVSDLPICVVISTPSVVKNFCMRDENNERYIMFFGDQPRYFPRKMHIHNVKYDNPMDDLLINILNSNLIGKRRENNDDEFLFDMPTSGIKDPLFEAKLMHHFCSSTKQADTTMEKMQQEGGYEKYRFENQVELTKMISKLRRESGRILKNKGKKDTKINKLMNIIDNFPNEKIVIFCVYQQTSEYLRECFQNLRPHLNIETTNDKRNGDELNRVITLFAPEANRFEKENETEDDFSNKTEDIDVLIATDAIAEGFNLQDASVLVNFDLPWTVLVLAQRIGRILRPWKNPREIYVFNLFPSTMDNESVHYALHWQNRLEKRNREFKDFADIPVIIGKDQKTQSKGFEMIQLAKAIGDFDNAHQNEMDLDKVVQFIQNAEEIYTTSFIDDLALITSSEKKYIQNLPNGIKSIKSSSFSDSSNQDFIFLLLGYRDQTFPTIFNRYNEIVMDHDKMDEIMQIIRSPKSEEAPLPNIDNCHLDIWVEKCRDKWASLYNIDPEHLTIINRMLLIPSH